MTFPPHISRNEVDNDAVQTLPYASRKPMRSNYVAACCAALLLSACGGGSGGTYTSVGDDAGVLELKSGGAFSFTVPGMGTTEGTYTVDGEKIMLTMSGQTHTLLKTGNCLEDQRMIFSRMCVGGKAGDASSAAASGVVAEAPSGTWKSTSELGEFTLEFKGGNTVSLTATAPNMPADSRQGTYVMEGRMVNVRLDGGEPLVLTFVNGAYETMSFGTAMKFVKQ
jgi:hypothetical protein